MDIGTHDYGRESSAERLYADNPVIATVVDELRARGAGNRGDAQQLLPELEQDLGELTNRERTAVLARFDH